MITFEEIQKQLEEYIPQIEVEVKELDSYEYSPAVYSWQSSCCGPAEEYWDEDEEYEAQVEKLIEYIEADGLGEYINVSGDEYEQVSEDKELKEKVINWLESKLS